MASEKQSARVGCSTFTSGFDDIFYLISTPVKVCDCILHGCDAITLTDSVLRQAEI